MKEALMVFRRALSSNKKQVRFLLHIPRAQQEGTPEISLRKEMRNPRGLGILVGFQNSGLEGVEKKSDTGTEGGGGGDHVKSKYRTPVMSLVRGEKNM